MQYDVKIDTAINDMGCLAKNKYILIESSNDYFNEANKYIYPKKPVCLHAYDGNYLYEFEKLHYSLKQKNEIFIKISFDSFSKIYSSNKANKYTKVEILFRLSAKDTTLNLWDKKKLNSLIIQDQQIYLSIENNNLVVTLKSDNISKAIIANIINIIFVYHYFISGHFIKRIEGVNYLLDEELVTEYFLNGKFDKLENNNYSKLKIQLLEKDYIRGLKKFYELHDEVSYPIQLFILSQSNIEYQIQQRVAIILNTLEGIIKINDNKKLKRFNKDKRNFLINLSVDELNRFYESDQFTEKVGEILISKTLKSTVIKDMKESLYRLHHDTFANTLVNSKKISVKAFDFVKESKIVFRFWQRCKDHRNFFAHLTDSDFKGFTGPESYAVMMILSSYYRLIVIQLVGLTEQIQDIDISNEIAEIELWKSKNEITDF